LSRYEAAYGGGETSPGRKGEASGAAWSTCDPHDLHCLFLQPSCVPPGQGSTGHWAHPPVDRSSYWERCLLYPQLKVEKHPASDTVHLQLGSGLRGLLWAGLGAVQETGTCRWYRTSSRTGHPATPVTRYGQVSHDLPCQEAALLSKWHPSIPRAPPPCRAPSGQLLPGNKRHMGAGVDSAGIHMASWSCHETPGEVKLASHLTDAESVTQWVT